MLPQLAAQFVMLHALTERWEVTGLDSVMLSFTGNDATACQCGEQGGTEMVLHTLTTLSQVSCGFHHRVSPAAKSRKRALKKKKKPCKRAA